jgi:hypothetical protein
MATWPPCISGRNRHQATAKATLKKKLVIVLFNSFSKFAYYNYLKISWDLKELIPVNFVLFYLNEGQNLLRVRWDLMDEFPPMEQSIKSFVAKKKNFLNVFFLGGDR